MFSYSKKKNSCAKKKKLSARKKMFCYYIKKNFLGLRKKFL